MQYNEVEIQKEMFVSRGHQQQGDPNLLFMRRENVHRPTDFSTLLRESAKFFRICMPINASRT